MIKVGETFRGPTLCSEQGELQSCCSGPCPVKFWVTSKDEDSTTSLGILLQYIPNNEIFFS